jgi:hypothetical protein
MAITSFPYVSIDGDRKITAAQEAQGFDNFVASGIVPDVDNECEVSKVPDTLNVSVNTGAAIISGHRLVSDAAVELTHSAGDESHPRYDIIALESNANTGTRAANFVIVEGIPAAEPELPALTNDDAIQQQEMYRILIPAGATNLNSATLTDSRVFATGRHSHAAADISIVDSGDKITAIDVENALQEFAAAIATKLAASSYTAADVLAKIKTVDGAGSGLDADLLDGHTTVYFQTALSSDQTRKITISASNPSGGSDGDIWLKY